MRNLKTPQASREREAGANDADWRKASIPALISARCPILGIWIAAALSGSA